MSDGRPSCPALTHYRVADDEHVWEPCLLPLGHYGDHVTQRSSEGRDDE